MRANPRTGLVLRIAVAAIIVAATAYAVFAPPREIAPSPRITGEIQHFVMAGNPRAPAPFTFVDGSGRRLGLADFRGRVVVLNFWATWCAPCIKEMPSLDALAAAMKGRPFKLIALNEDRQGEIVARPFLEKLGLANLPLYLDPGGEVQRALDVRALPTTIVFDPRGREVGRLVGPADWASPEARELVLHFMERAP